MNNGDNLVLEHLRAIRSDLADVRETQAEHGQRLTRIEHAIVGVRRDQTYDAENVAHHGSRLDRLFERVERLERRLELNDDA